MSKSLAHCISDHINIFFAGLLDSVSIHKTIPLMVNNPAILFNVLRILATNTVLLLGSVSAFNYGLSPGLQFMQYKLSGGGDMVHMVEVGGFVQTGDLYLAWLLFHSVWVLPIFLLCYGCSITWYQELADEVFRYVRYNVAVLSIFLLCILQFFIFYGAIT